MQGGGKEQPSHELRTGLGTQREGMNMRLAKREFRPWLTRPLYCPPGLGRFAIQGVPPGPLTKTSAKISPAYSRSPCSPRALSASSSPGRAHGPGCLSVRPGEALVPAGTPSGTGAFGGSGSRETAGLCKGEGLESAPGRSPKLGGGILAASASHQHPPSWRWGRDRALTSSRWNEDPQRKP